MFLFGIIALRRKSRYFSGEVVRDIINRRLTKKMCAEFTNFICAKGFIDETAEYLPRLLKWVGDKIIFWQTDLGRNLVQSNTKNIGVYITKFSCDCKF